MQITTIPLLNKKTKKQVAMLTPMSDAPLSRREIQTAIRVAGFDPWQVEIDYTKLRAQSVSFPSNGKMIENIITIDPPQEWHSFDIDNPVQPMKVLSIFADHEFNELEIRHAIEQEGFAPFEYEYSLETFDLSAEHEF